eukprot:362754-Chlamydomonas_euryale.AAC.4
MWHGFCCTRRPQQCAKADVQDSHGARAGGRQRELKWATSTWPLRHSVTAPDHRAEADAQDCEALMLAADNGHLAVVHLLLDLGLTGPDHRAKADARESRALVRVTENGRVDMVRLLQDQKE